MTTRLVAVIVATMVVIGACDGEVPSVEEPESAETCEGLIDIGDQLVRAYAQVLDQTDVGDLTQGVADENLQELGRIGDDLDVRAARLGCDFAQLNAAIIERTADLEPTSPTVEMLLDVVRAGAVGDPPTTSTSTPPSTSAAP